MAKDRSRNDKGILLEQIVALLHQTEGVRVETNVELPPKSGDKFRKREIDVLLTASVANYPVRIAIQCKNYKKKITIGQLGEFKDLLDDVGIPYQHGILVSVNGFQSGVIARASELGIRTLELDGLTADRLAAEVRRALQFFVYLLAEVTELTIRNEIPEGKLSAVYAVSFADRKNRFRGLALDLIASDWRKGRIPVSLGLHELNFRVPDGWIQLWNGKAVKTHFVRATVRVSAQYITQLEGTYKKFALRNPETDSLERMTIQADFSTNTSPAVITQKFFTEEELVSFLRSQDISIIHRLRLPRILFNAMFYPLSKRAVAILREQAKRMTEAELLARGPMTFDEIEGKVAGSIHEEPWRGFPALVEDGNGNLIDLRLLMDDKEYLRVVSLRRFIEEASTPELAEVLAVANEGLHRQILGKT